METQEVAATGIKTTLHIYSFDLDKPEDREPYHQLKLRLEKTLGRGHRMHASKSPGDRDYIRAGEITLEPEFLFENQWNSDIGRVFDWYEEAIFSPYTGKENKLIKRGHYIDITPEMVAIRKNTLKCGYTGQQFAAADFEGKPRFNTTHRGLGDPYLKETELHLLRLLPVCETSSRPELTQAERDFLLPLYIQAQTKSQEKKRAKQLIEVESEYAKKCAIAKTEHDGELWLLQHGINIENCIFYDHLGQFCFGWRQPYGFNAEQALKKALEGFPFSYEIKTV